MAYRFEPRSTTPGDYRWKTNFFTGLVDVDEVRVDIDRGDGLSGTLTGIGGDYPTQSNVRLGVSYNEGTYEGAFEVPDDGDVRLGVHYDDDSVGKMWLPVLGNVVSGVGYGEDGAEYTGTYTG